MGRPGGFLNMGGAADGYSVVPNCAFTN